MSKERAARRKPSTAGHAKAKVRGAQSPAHGNPLPSRPPVPDKYATLSVYDPARREVVAADGSRTKAADWRSQQTRRETVVTATPVLPPNGNTVTPLDQMPGPLAALERLYVCEVADEKTVKMLAALAQCSVAELEHRRLDWTPKAKCVPVVPLNRRRCINCPFWEESNATPF